MLEERLEQVREIDGELAYEKMRRAVEKASQEKASQEKARQARQVERARQVESARLERAMQETARQSRDRRGPERGDRSGTMAPAARSSPPLVGLFACGSCRGGQAAPDLTQEVMPTMKNLEQYKDDLKQLLETGQTLRLAMQLECDPEQVEEVLKRAEKANRKKI